MVRAIAIATQKPYREVYRDLSALARSTRSRTAYAHRGGSIRDGCPPAAYKRYLAELGWTWTPTMRFGTGCTVHLRADELPGGRLIVSLSKHLSAVIDGVIHDTHDPSRDGTRCCYGYFRKED